MKKLLSFVVLILLISCWNTGFSANPANNGQDHPDLVAASQAMNIVCSPEVINLANTLVKEYGKVNPGEKVSVIMQDNPPYSGVQGLNILTEENLQVSNHALPWRINIARDAVVAVVNADLPVIDKISHTGLTAQQFARLLNSQTATTWETLIPGGPKASVKLYIPAGEPLMARIASFAGMEAAGIKGAVMSTSGVMIEAVQKNIYSVGFCKMSELIDPATNDFFSHIRIVPVDKNQNGRIDGFEDIYGGKDEFIHGVWIGKYPKTLCCGIYAAAPEQPTGKSEVAFLEWMVSGGQAFLLSTGFSELTGIQKQIAMETISPSVLISEKEVDHAGTSGWILVLVSLVVAGLMFLPLVLFRKKRTAIAAEDFSTSPILNQAMVSAPSGVFFDKTHTWAFMEKDGLVKLGIDDFILHITGSLTRVVMKSPGEKIRKGEIVLTIIRDGKQLNLYAPVTGTIRENNHSLLNNSSLLNTSPYSEGWIYMIEPRNWLKEIQHLLLGNQYREWLKEEIVRLKDFFATTVNSNSLAYSHVVLQDGGEIANEVLADLGPEVWEDFQTEFIDSVR
jgi:glycine cleavage system H lipoate-binding protein/ABC-type phosphate transport system substrate-binding protein